MITPEQRIEPVATKRLIAIAEEAREALYASLGKLPISPEAKAVGTTWRKLGPAIENARREIEHRNINAGL